MDTASSAFDPLASEEAGLHSGQKPDAKGAEQGPRTEVHNEWSRTMVELGSLHMNEAFPKKYFDKLELVSLLDHYPKLQCVT